MAYEIEKPPELYELIKKIEEPRHMQTVLKKVRKNFAAAANIAHDDFRNRVADRQPNPEVVLSFQGGKRTTILLSNTNGDDFTIHILIYNEKGVDYSRYSFANRNLSTVAHGFIPDYANIDSIKPALRNPWERPEDLQSQDMEVLRNQAIEMTLLTRDLNRAHQRGISSRLPDVEFY